MDRRIFAYVFFALIFLSVSAFAYQISASTNKIVYLVNETVNISGTIDNTSSIAFNISIYNSTNSAVNSTITNATNGTFSALYFLNNTPSGDYFVMVMSGSDFLNLSFRVTDSIKAVEARLVANMNITPINTSKLNAPGDLGGNFTDIFSLNKSGVYYGNSTLYGTDYHFLLLDANQNSTFDTVFVDDDKSFELYNYTEDSTGFVEQQNLRKGSLLQLNGTNYTIASTNESGSAIILAMPVNSSVYSSGSNVSFLVVAKSSGILVSGYNVTVAMSSINSTTSLANLSGVTNSFGYFNGTFTAPAAPGIYKITVNGEPCEIFFVESFSLKGMVTDDSGNPAYAFSPDPLIKIKAISKTTSGTSISLDSVYADIIYPSGSVARHTLSAVSAGVYSDDVSMSGASNGEYRVKITGVYNSISQEFSTGFAIEAVGLETIAFNPQYIDMFDKGGPGFAMNAFAPNKNVTAMVLLTNISAGGIYAEGSPAVIDIDNSSTATDECSTRVQLIELKDELGNSYLNNITYNSTNFTTAFTYFNIPAEQTSFMPDEIKRQCVLRIAGLNKTGIYRAKIKVIHPLGTKISGATFGIQKFYAIGETVDMKGENFAFFSTNSTVRIKLKIKDLGSQYGSNYELPPGFIKNVKIVSMQKEFPVYEDALTSSYMSLINESISNGTLAFTSPLREGFYTMKFRFMTNISDDGNKTNLSGIGTASFMLKKYIIWTDLQLPENATGNQWFAKQGQNISLRVSIVDVSQGSRMDMGMSSGLTCTGCEGLVANVTKLFNDQLMIEIPSSAYSVAPGNVLNSTSGATITIIPAQNLSTGWYGLDVMLYNPDDINETYFGWGGFEIKNFFVETMKLEHNGTDYISSMGMGGPSSNTFEIGTPVLFAVVAKDPSDWSMIELAGAPVIDSVSSMNSWPPPKVYYNSSIAKKNVTIGSGPQPQKMEMWVINLTSIRKQSNASASFNDTLANHQANVRASTASGSDIGSFFFDIAVYQADAVYRGMDEWPAKFASAENLTVNFAGSQFDNSPHNLGNVTITNIFSMKQGMPKRAVFGTNYFTNCTLENCTLNLNLSSTNMTTGMYRIEFKIFDEFNWTKAAAAEITVSDVVIAIPSIEQVGMWMTDTATKTIDLDNDRDRCYNEKWLAWDEFTSNNQQNLNDEQNITIGLMDDECVGENNTVCLGLGQPENANFTVPFTKVGAFAAMVFCVHLNGTLTGPGPGCIGVENWTNVGVITNGTDWWINKSADMFSQRIDFTGIPANHTGDNLNVSGRNWTLLNIFKVYPGQGNATELIDRQLVQSCGPYEGNCVNIILPNRYDQIKTSIFCVNDTSPSNWENNNTCHTPGEVIYMVSNSTHLWASNTADMTGLPGIAKDGSFNANGETWKIIAVGTCGDNNNDPSCILATTSQRYGRVNISVGDNQYALINVSEKYPRVYASGFCIRNNGEWNNQPCSNQTPGTDVFLVSNTTHMGINTTDSVMVLNITNSTSSTFVIGNNTWNLTSIGGQNNENKIIMKLAGNKTCGSAWINCGPEGCEEVSYMLELNKTDSSVYHGLKNLVESNMPPEFEQAFSTERNVYVYHNTTHLWMSNTTNLSAVAPVAKGQVVNDSFGGQWNVTLLNKRSVRLKGVNVLASTGAFINTSLSQTGSFKIGVLRESDMGAWNKNGGQRAGIDVNFDSFKNGTFYLAISDNVTTGIYDTLFFAGGSNFTNLYNVTSIGRSMENRGIGPVDAVTLLNIPPRADSIYLYSQAPGDWSELGEYRLNNDTNITVPILIKSPSGGNADANVSIPFVRNERTRTISYLNPQPNASITGIGEISVNLSALPAGEYTLAINVARNGASELLDEWKWPRATTRVFLTDISIGRGSWVSGFAPMNTTRYDWENYPEIPDLYATSVNGNNYTGVFSYMNNGQQGDDANISLCSNNLVYPAAAVSSPGYNLTFTSSELPGYFFFTINTSPGGVWIMDNCTFNQSASYNYANSTNKINMTRSGKVYMLYVLYANATQDSSRGVIIGVPGIDSSVMLPIRTEMWGGTEIPKWKIMSVRLGGINYSVIFANDTYEYPMCSVWNTDCAKKAWFSATGNFTTSLNASIGQNFTSDLYIAKMGPGPWDGLVIANFSNIASMWPNLPMLDVKPVENTVIYFGIFNESSLGIDLDMNVSSSNVYYAVAFDDKEDGQTNMTAFKIDDDLQITDDYWGDYSDPQNPSYYDFNSAESGMRESWRNLPSSIYKGSIMFGSDSDYQNVNYESKPEWDIVVYNNTHMLIQKQKWWNNLTDNITLIIRAYNFNQSALQGANVSVSKVTKFTNMGPQNLAQGTHYNVTQVQNVTDSYGYGILSVTRAYPWDEGEYMVALNIQYGTTSQISYQWFRASPYEMPQGPG